MVYQSAACSASVPHPFRRCSASVPPVFRGCSAPPSTPQAVENTAGYGHIPCPFRQNHKKRATRVPQPFAQTSTHPPISTSRSNIFKDQCMTFHSHNMQATIAHMSPKVNVFLIQTISQSTSPLTHQQPIQLPKNHEITFFHFFEKNLVRNTPFLTLLTETKN